MVTDKNLFVSNNKNRHLQLKPAQIIVLGFLSIILIGAFVLSLPISNNSGNWLNILDALFTATTAVCVTGLIVVPTAVTFTFFGQLVILILIQMGGLGFMTVATLMFLLIKKKITMKDRIVMQEALNTDTTRGVVKLMKYVVISTFVVELIGTLILLPSFVILFGASGVFKAIFTAVSAFCNAGIDIVGTVGSEYIGLSYFVNNTVVSLTVTFLIILGGLGFAVILDIIKVRRIKRLSIHSKLVLLTTGILLVGGTVFFMASEYNNVGTIGAMSFGDKLVAAFFQSVTTRTAGFNTIDQNALNPASKLMSMILMFIGASPASTGGGIKTTTLALLVLMIVAGIKNADGVTMSKKSISTRACFRAVSIILFALMLVISLTMLLLITERNTMPEELYSLDNFLFESFSAFGTVGLSMGITPHLTNIGKILVMLVMLFGRVGPMTIGLMFIGSKKKIIDIKFPEGNIMLG